MQRTKRLEPAPMVSGLLGGLVLVLSAWGPWCKSAQAEDEPPACRAGLRLRAVQFDPVREERSYAIFANAAQLRRGSRVAEYAIERIEQGQVILASQGQRCSVRLRGAPPERELRTISVAAMRGELRARKLSLRDVP